MRSVSTTCADAIAQFIWEKGITHAFGIIGAGNAALFDAIHRAKKTEIVCCHHEQAAVMAASYFARVHDSRRGVSLVTTGAGSSNAATGALAALMDNVPVLIISGNEPSRYLEHEARVIGVQGFHTARVAQHVTKQAWKTTSGAQAASSVWYALDEILMNEPGPIWIDIPRDFFNAAI